MTPGICSVLVATPIQRAGAAASFKAIVAVRYSKGPSLPRRLHSLNADQAYAPNAQEVGAVEQMSKATGAQAPEPEARPAGWLPMNEKHEDNLDRVWDIIEKVGVTMLTTQFSGGLRELSVGERRQMTVLGVVQRLAGRRISGADQSITATRAPAELAPHIDCRAGEAVLRVDRIYFDPDRQPLELAVNHFNPARYTYRFHLRATRS